MRVLSYLSRAYRIARQVWLAAPAEPTPVFFRVTTAPPDRSATLIIMVGEDTVCSERFSSQEVATAFATCIREFLDRWRTRNVKHLPDPGVRAATRPSAFDYRYPPPPPFPAVSPENRPNLDGAAP